MKKISTLLFGIVLTITILNSQVAPPQAFSFKATIKDKYGLPVLVRKINLRITILQSDMNGFPVYSEYFKPTTDLYSQVDVQIGQGTVISGNFISVDWSANKYFLRIEVDIYGGTNYQLLSVTQLLSVPYALYAGKSGSAVVEADPIFSLHPARGITNANISNWNTASSWGNHALAGYLTSEVDGSITNELQHLSIDGDVISLTNGGSVKLPASATFTGVYFYADRDNDNYGDPFSPVWVPTGVTPPIHFVNEIDCNDGNPNIHPGATEICGDGIDQDCTGSDLICSGGIDNDGDGYTISENDCDDNNPAIHPGAAEICDGLDNDCDMAIDEDIVAPLSDRNIGVCMGIRKICDGVNGWKEPDYSTLQGYQDNETICDRMDNDCDGQVDEGCTSCTNNSQCPNGQCVNGFCVTVPEQDNDADGYKTSQGDCNDNDPTIHPGAIEIIGDGIDQDCNGTDATNVPTSFDWRNVNGQNWITPVKNQGQCGSCYAVATVAAFEAKIKIQSNNPALVIDLSEQEIVSCSTAPPNQGCNGGNPGIVLNYIRDNGIVEESVFPYTSGSGSAPECISFTGQKKYKIGGWENLTSMDPDAIKKALINKGPVVFLTYSDNSLMSYNSGIYNPPDPGHAPNKTMLLVGYNDAEGYWIIENTWGTWWGENGFYKLGYASTAALGASKYVINNAVGY